MIRLECKDGAHYKFWEAEVKGAALHVHFGRIGTAGQSHLKNLGTPAAAHATLEKVMTDKLAHGYVKKGGAAAASAKKAAPPKTNAHAKQDTPLLRLAELLAPGHAKTKARVALALSNPDAYKKKFLVDRSKNLHRVHYPYVFFFVREAAGHVVRALSAGEPAPAEGPRLHVAPPRACPAATRSAVSLRALRRTG